MSKPADELLTSLVTRAIEGIDAAVSFSQAQIPDVINQLLMWNTVSSLLFQVLAILVITLGVMSVRHAYKARKNREPWVYISGVVDDRYFVSSGAYDLCLIASIPCVLAGAVLLVCNFDWLKILVAPKLYLIEYAAYLMK